MAEPKALLCIRCGRAHPTDHYDRGCEACAIEGIACNLTVSYTDAPRVTREELAGAPATLWRYADALPVDPHLAISLGEGMTPLLPVDGVGHDRLFIKDESRNPTWSFKDRLASVAVSVARAMGARVIATSSTGNAGAAAAAYAARAGLPCIVFTIRGAAGPMLTQMRAYGAMVLAVDRKDDRWTLLSAGVERFGWFPTSPFFGPAVGSNPYGVEGYKTLAYEIVEQLGWQPPDWCVLPVCYGDALYGLWKGFEDMRAWGWIDRCPRLVAAETSGSLAAALDSGNDMPPDVPRASASIAVSIDMSRGTYQSLHALRKTRGHAIAIDDHEIELWQARLASTVGLFAEPSSVAAVAAVDRLSVAGTIKPGETVVALSTASGLKDVAAADRRLPDVPTIGPDIEAALRCLKERYGYDG